MAAAYQHNGAPCTREHFYAVACDPARSIVVEACAGAGKTWMLVSRILRALLGGSAPHEILAITFTKKAAGEMRARLLQWLTDFAHAHAEETPEAWALRLQKELISRGIDPQAALDNREQLLNLHASLLGHGRPVQIRTFHGWFAALLKAAPISVLQDLGLPTSYELLESDEDAVAEVWRPFLRAVAADEALALDYRALVAQLGRHNARKALESALARRTEFALADEAGCVEGAVAAFDVLYPRLAGVEEPSDWLLARAPGRALLLEAAEALAPLAKTYAEKGVELKSALQAGDWDAVVAALFTLKGEPRAFAKDKTPPIVRSAQDEVALVRAACEQQQAHQHQQRMARLTRVLLACFAQLKRERGWVDMNDLERAAFTLLDRHELSAWVQERLDARIRHLLVDEFQDTNPLQWQALKAWLAGYAGAGGGQGAPGVFIVGDPKQSIYRFRRADPRVFAAARDFVVQALGGERLATDHTRRNAPGVLAAVNTVMGAAQDAGEFSDYRAHTTESAEPGRVLALPLIARPPKAGAGDAAEPGTWRDSLTTPRTELEDTLRTLECRQAARWIAGRIAAGVPSKEIMVLARKREPLTVLQTELRLLGIACEQPDKSWLADQPAVLDVLALVDALLSPGHDLMLARALKSPLFGLQDEDLKRIALAVRAAGEPRPAWLDVLPNVELQALNGQALHADLMRYRQWLFTLPPHDALQAIFAERDAPARFAAAAPPPERARTVAHLRALLSAALSVQGGRFLTAYQWLHAMRRERLPVPRHAAPEAVRLLTVHGAKGLEADEVLLLDSASGLSTRGEPEVLLAWPGDAPAPEQFVFLAKSSAPPASAQDLHAAEATAQAREELNALYVAMTRARSALVLSGVEPHTRPSGTWWQRLQPLAQALPAQPEVGPASSSAPTLTLLVLPPLPLGEGRGEGFFHEQNRPVAPATQVLPAIQSEASPDSDTSRIGQAMHWLLEHAGEIASGWLPERLAHARKRFALDAAQTAQAEALARRIFTGEAAWAWSADEVLQAFNEVEVVHEGERLRIDRLVRRRAGAHGPEAWWVLDYKSAAHPERDESLQAQLARYRVAVESRHPGEVVHMAFVSGNGAVLVASGDRLISDDGHEPQQ